MTKKLILLFFCNFIFAVSLYSQENTISVHSTLKSKILDSLFVYSTTKNNNLTHFLQEKNLPFYPSKKSLANQTFWLKATIKNTENDTLFLILSVGNVSEASVFFSNKGRFQEKHAGYLINSKLLDFKDNYSAVKFELLPNQEKKIAIEVIENYRSSENVRIRLQSQENYNEKIIERIKDRNYLYVIFTLLTGGIFLMFGYNLLLFFLYRERIYLYYSLHLLFTLLNYFMVCDALHKDFTGNLNKYTDLIIENTYVLSFIFYTTFIYAILEKASKAFMKKIFFSYLGFMLLYLLSVNGVYFLDDQSVISKFIYVAFLFRIISIIYAFVIIILLIKTHKKNTYLKYILIGTIVLVSSYFLHVISNLMTDNYIGNHYFNLIGSLIEILFFTYALNLRKKMAENERDVLIKMNLIKSRFFANISHEFRTPLTLIKSPVQSLKAEITDTSQLKKLDLIAKNANRMLELVDQLLELSKLDNGNLQLILREGNVAIFLHSLLEVFEYQAKEKNLLFVIRIEDTNENHFFDKDVLEKIIDNLLSNALKYTSENETIVFETSIKQSNLKIIVSNTGSGVKKEDLPKLFNRFYQKNETNKGVGIGLALVKELVDLYQGTIATILENDKLSFVITLPLAKSNENAVVIPNKEISANIETAKTQDTELPILLVVDDNAEIRKVIIDIFYKNYQILEAQDGEQALKIAKKEIPDCIISDVMMPKMDGFEFTTALKKDELTSFIPVVLLTAKTSDEAHLEALKSTADVYLTKPFNNEIVRATVLQLITERKKLQERYSKELVLRPTDIVINSVDEKFVTRLQKIIDQNVSKSDYSADDFAKDAAMSRMQLHRKLKTLFGVSTSEFLRNERLKIAAELLKKEAVSISEVAYLVGFNDVSYFSKCFKDLYKCTPTEFIEKK